jgi:CheY-like chemotaxis protein
MVALQSGYEQRGRGPEARAAGTHVLLVEGLTDARETLAELLEALGYHVTAVAGVVDARRVAAAPDVIISDLILPDGIGFNLVSELRAKPGWERVRTIALTAYDDLDNRSRATQAGFQEFLAKPVSIWVLHRMLQALVPA